MLYSFWHLECSIILAIGRPKTYYSGLMSRIQILNYIHGVPLKKATLTRHFFRISYRCETDFKICFLGSFILSQNLKIIQLITKINIIYINIYERYMYV